MGAICALTIGSYAWSARPGFLELWGGRAGNNYYSLLVQGFRAGQLHLAREAPPGLTQLAASDNSPPNSPDWVDATGLLDLSHYKGKLYTYFGVTPALVLFLPYLTVTGHYLPHKDAVVIFFAAGFLVSAGLLWKTRRWYFRKAGLGTVAVCLLTLGWANLVLACLPESGVHAVAISCGCALTMLTLALLWQAMHAPRWKEWWLAGASLAYGLAVGARPALLFGAVILLVPMGAEWRETAARGRRSRLWTLFWAAIVPISVIGLGLMLYNSLRFENPLEFGQRYQLPAGPRQQFSLHYLWFNFRVCLLEPARWGSYFPFVHHIVVPPSPKGSGGVFEAFGMLSNVPVVWLGLATPLVWHGMGEVAAPPLRWFLAAATSLFGICTLVLCLHDSMVLRYEVEFACILVLLAVMGLLALERALAGQPGWRRAARRVWALLLAFSIAFNLFAVSGRFSGFHVFRGFVYRHEGRMDKAIDEFQKALQWQPDNARAHNALGEVLLREGKVAEAIVQHEEVLRLAPAYAEAQNNLGVALFRLGRVPEALRHYKAALQIKPDFADAHFNLGVALLEQGNPAESITHLEAALRLRPGYARASFELGKALLEQGRPSEAIGHLEQGLRSEPEEAEAHYSLGMALVQLGRVPEAIAHLERALQMKPDDAGAHNDLGVALFQQGKAQEALGHLEAALRLKPDFANAHCNLGNLLATLGRMAEAVIQYEQALRIEPANAEACSQLAWVLATCGDPAVRNGARAVELAEVANKLVGNKDATVLDTLAAAYAEAGRYGEAVKTAEAALELARRASRAEQARQIAKRLELYQAQRPYHRE